MAEDVSSLDGLKSAAKYVSRLLLSICRCIIARGRWRVTNKKYYYLFLPAESSLARCKSAAAAA
jgi:hypothetical protein